MSNLIHAVARVRVLESELLTPSHVDRMISAESFAESYAVLDDLGYADETSRSRADLDFEQVLESGLYASQKIFTSFGLGNIFSIVTVLWDIQNIKTALKAFKKQESEENLEEKFVGYGSYTPYQIIQGVYYDSGLGAITGIIRSAKQAEQTSEMERIVEQGLFTKAFDNAGNDAFLKKYITLLQQSEDIKERVISTGDIGLVSATFGGSIWSQAFEKGRKSFLEDGDYSVFETQLDAAILGFLKQESRGKIDGYAPLFSFFWRKERNARVIRSVLLAKRAGLSSNEIRNEFVPFEF